MDKDKEFIAKKLFAIRNKYLDYFSANNCRILTCITVNWERPISVHLVNKELPFDISCDLEEMFWVGPDKIDLCNNIIVEINEQMNRSRKLRDNFNKLHEKFSVAYDKRVELINRIHN